MADNPVHVAPYFLYDFPTVPITEMFSRVAGTDADGIEFALLGDPDLEAIANRAAETDLGVGLLLSGEGDPAAGPMLTDPDQHAAAVEQLREDVAHAERLDCSNVTVLTGTARPALSRTRQLDAVADVLAAVAPDAAAAGVTLHVEPVCATACEEYFLRETSTAVELVERVDHPNVGILYDVYHQQNTEGNVIDTITDHLDHISYLHVANVPDRRPPGEGELAIENVVRAAVRNGYGGPIGCEFTAPDRGLRIVDEFCSFVEGL